MGAVISTPIGFPSLAQSTTSKPSADGTVFALFSPVWCDRCRYAENGLPFRYVTCARAIAELGGHLRKPFGVSEGFESLGMPSRRHRSDGVMP